MKLLHRTHTPKAEEDAYKAILQRVTRCHHEWGAKTGETRFCSECGIAESETTD